MIVGDWIGGWVGLECMAGCGWNGSKLMAGGVIWLSGEGWVG